MKRNPVLLFFVLVFAWTWGLAALMIVAPQQVEKVFGPIGVQNPLFYLAVYAPALSAIIVTAVTEGRDGLRHLFARLLHWRFPIYYYLLVLVGMTVLAIGLGHLAAIRTGTVVPPVLAGLRQLPMVLPVALLLDPGPLGEELGWRGFALPRMVERLGMVPATMLLGLIWGIWHWPAFRIPGLPQAALNFPLFVVGTIGLSVVIAWLVWHTGGSVIIAILAHLAVNDIGGLFGTPFLYQTTALTLLAAILVVADSGFRRGTFPQRT